MTYEQKLRMVDMMHITDSSNREYWAGYKRGIQRAHLGTSMVTDDDHHAWMTMSGDKKREDCCRGYRDGFEGNGPAPGEW